MKALIGLLLTSACFAGGCKPVKLDKDQFYDQSCHIFRHVRVEGNHSIVKEKNGKVVARETIDCSKAVLDYDGTYEYRSHLANGHFYCPKEINDIPR